MPISKTNKPKRRFSSLLKWTLWVLLAQVILINISAALHAYKFTHFYNAKDVSSKKDNILSKTWHLFAGTRFQRSLYMEPPLCKVDSVNLKTSDGLVLKGWYSKTDSASKGAVILFHGLSGNKSSILDKAYEFRYLGYDVLLIDSRAHGESDGSATTIGFRESEDVRLAYDHLVARGEKRIILWGYSMGATEIMKAVAEYSLKPARIILEAPFLSMQTHIKGRARTMGFPQQPYGFLVTLWVGIEQGFNAFRFNMSSYGKQVTCPVLLMYGKMDHLVRKEETEKIFHAIASAQKKLVEFPVAYHEPLLTNNPNLWRNEVEMFLAK